MRLSKHRRDHALAFSMTPMIDIVFLLLIFFMTVSQISQVNRQFLQLPQVGHLDDESSRVAVTISIDRNGAFVRDGEQVDFQELSTSLQQDLSSVGDPQKISLLVRCDRRSPSSAVNRLVARCRDLGIHSIRAAVLE